MKYVQPVRLIERLGRGTQRLAAGAGQIHPGNPVAPAAFDPDPVAIPPDGAAGDLDLIHVAARNADPHETRSRRVSALEGYSGQVQPGE